MATNPFFSNYINKNEQELIDSLVVESVQIGGMDVIYVTRKLENEDEIFNQDDMSKFDAAYDIEMVVKSVDNFEGEGDFLSKFGLTIRDQITFVVPMRTFEKYVTRNVSRIQRPFEGDLIYFPLSKSLFKIMFVEHEAVFYQLGKLNSYELRCELFEYSYERFETGRPDIDNIFSSENTLHTTNLEDLNEIDPIAKNFDFELEGNKILDFSEIDPFAETIIFPDVKAPDEPS